jgi:hypothetical protein
LPCALKRNRISLICASARVQGSKATARRWHGSDLQARD